MEARISSTAISASFAVRFGNASGGLRGPFYPPWLASLGAGPAQRLRRCGTLCRQSRELQQAGQRRNGREFNLGRGCRSRSSGGIPARSPPKRHPLVITDESPQVLPLLHPAGRARRSAQCGGHVGPRRVSGFTRTQPGWSSLAGMWARSLSLLIQSALNC